MYSLYWLLMERLIAIPSTMHSGTALFTKGLSYNQDVTGPDLKSNMVVLFIGSPNQNNFYIVKIEASSIFSGYSIVFSLWPVQWKEHLCVLKVLALKLKEILIIIMLFLVIAMYCQASSINHSTSNVASWLGKKLRYMQQVAIHLKQPIYYLNFLTHAIPKKFNSFVLDAMTSERAQTTFFG